MTGATKCKLEWYLKKQKKKILKNQGLDGPPENHLEPIPRRRLCQGRDNWPFISKKCS